VWVQVPSSAVVKKAESLDLQASCFFIVLKNLVNLIDSPSSVIPLVFLKISSGLDKSK